MEETLCWDSKLYFASRECVACNDRASDLAGARTIEKQEQIANMSVSKTRGVKLEPKRTAHAYLLARSISCFHEETKAQHRKSNLGKLLWKGHNKCASPADPTVWRAFANAHQLPPKRRASAPERPQFYHWRPNAFSRKSRSTHRVITLAEFPSFMIFSYFMTVSFFLALRRPRGCARAPCPTFINHFADIFCPPATNPEADCRLSRPVVCRRVPSSADSSRQFNF